MRRGRAWVVAGVLLAAWVLASVPYVYGYLIRPPGTRFWAVPPINSGDSNQYLAFTRIAAEGHLLIGDPFTSEPHQPRLFLPQVLFQALLCRLFGWTPIGAFQASRVLSGAALLLAGWGFGCLLLRPWRLRRLYLGFLCFSAGAGWFVDHLGLRIPSGDVLQPEGNTFFTLGNLPHLCLSAALLTGLFAALLLLERALIRMGTHHGDTETRSKARSGGEGEWGSGGKRSAVGSRQSAGGAETPFRTPNAERRTPILLTTALLSFLLSWTHPFDYLALGLGLGGYVIARLVTDRRVPVASVLHLAAVGLGALPAGIYLTWITRVDPVYAALANDPLKVQPFAYYAIAHGPLALPALVVLLRPELRRRYALPLCWVLFAFLFLLTPFRLGGKQPRVLGGIHVPLALLATVGVDWLGRRSGARRRVHHGDTETGSGGEVDSGQGSAVGSRQDEPKPRPRTPNAERRTPNAQRLCAAAVPVFYLALTATGVYGMLERHFWWYSRRAPDFYMSRSVQEMYRYLDSQSDWSQVTLGGNFTGGWTPTWADSRAYHGHWHMTLRVEEKTAARDWFYFRTLDPGARSYWLRENHITWVIYYPWEWQWWGIQPIPVEGVPGLRRVFSTPELALYRWSGAPE